MLATKKYVENRLEYCLDNVDRRIDRHRDRAFSSIERLEKRLANMEHKYLMLLDFFKLEARVTPETERLHYKEQD